MAAASFGKYWQRSSSRGEHDAEYGAAFVILHKTLMALLLLELDVCSGGMTMHELPTAVAQQDHQLVGTQFTSLQKEQLCSWLRKPLELIATTATRLRILHAQESK
jgi:hypothetical protein